MKYQGFQYSFTMKELRYLLARKKTCPYCQGALHKIKTFRAATSDECNEGHRLFFAPNTIVKKYEYFYKCERCGREMPLKELAEKYGSPASMFMYSGK